MNCMLAATLAVVGVVLISDSVNAAALGESEEDGNETIEGYNNIKYYIIK